MMEGPSLEEVLAVISAASSGDAGARVRLPEKPDPEHVPTRLAIALNDLLDGFSSRVGQDVTERARLEDQLRQSQKMEAVGRLAGGVAHDFNNVLSVILSYSEIVISDLTPGDPRLGDVEEIQKAAKRATGLTKQLLMFSRQQVLERRVIDLNDLLVGMDKMLRTVLGADVDLVSVSAPDLGRIRVDPSSVEQVILNLVVNARDAMAKGGKLTLETGNVVLDEAYALEHMGAQPGPHVMLAVTDTGSGMGKATLARIFEPFFTTKPTGKGTGLGLSTVFGIAQQSGGSVWVHSEPGKGTTFKVYFPRVSDSLDVRRTVKPPITRRGSETILLVEDDDQVRIVARGILGLSGYRVLEARNARDAILRSERHQGKIHLLLADVVMPHMSGPELASRLVAARPDMKVLCMSGYTDDSIVRHGVLEADVAFLQKPITPESLTTKIREVLDAAPSSPEDES
jgi:two-component system, cell cycle sensor histidine kinase and response regulator CckA